MVWRFVRLSDTGLNILQSEATNNLTATILALFTAIGYGFSKWVISVHPKKRIPVLLTLSELQFVINSLEKEPYKDAAPIIQK